MKKKTKVPEFHGVSALVKDLIKKILVKPSQRLAASQRLNHEWMQKKLALNDAALKLNRKSLKNFYQYSKLKKAALFYIASQLSEHEITKLGKIFKSIDKNNDGVLTYEEIKNGILKSFNTKNKKILL